MLLPELKQRAAELGIKMPPKSRKADYIAAIQEKLSGSTQSRESGSAQPPQRTRKVRKSSTGDADASADSLDVAKEAPSIAEKRNRGRNNARTAEETGVKSGKVEMTPEEKQAALDALGDAAQRRADHKRNSDGTEVEGERENGHHRRERNGRRDRRDRNGRRNRRERNNNDRRNVQGEESLQYEEQHNSEDAQAGNEEVLIPVAGILDTAGTNSYLRTGGYLPGKSDAYVSQQTIKKYGLRRGDAVVGAVRSVTDGAGRRGQRQHKYNPLVEVTSVNGLTPEAALQRPEFNKLTPLYPQEMLRMETTKNALTTRVIDLVAPIGKGQRGLIVSPPKAGKTMVMQQMAVAIAKNNPNVHLMVVLVDERPEEVTDMQRLVKGEVIASTFDRPASDHAIVAELAVERAKRLVELGQDVVILLDSLTRLSRAYNLAAPASGRILSGGVDAAALYPPKKFFGAARNIEDGGSLTIIASALVETGSKMDEVIFEEFKGTGNMELRLSRQLADRRIFPAVDVNASGTRREEQLFSPEELKIVWHLRRALGTLDVQEASDYLLGRLRKTESNKEFLVSIVRGMQANGAE
ncbi:transcription termination factor Rho [Arcanobacterium hippocoleae]|nr:transcription termination factor Rho [Arcanobacterium hippocoleae]